MSKSRSERIPETGIDHDKLLETMDGFKEGDADWERGRTWSLVYYPGEEHYQLLKKAYTKFFSANGLNPMAFKSLKKMESDVVDMTAEMLNGDDEVVGTMTSGGTESILMAVKAARDRASFLRKAGIRKPELVAPRTIHPAFAKACHYFGLDINYAPVDDNYRAIPSELEKRIGFKTVLVAASAPQYPHGMIDPIAEIGEMAESKGVPFHVDACFGGYLLPWLEDLGYDVPLFDFRVPGVTSISADVHKYGYASKGASTILYRDMSYLRHQFFISTEFPGGIYASPTMAGTRPGGAIAAAWASLKGMGKDGYRESAQKAMEAKKRLRRQIEEIPEMETIGSEDATIVAYRSNTEEVDTLAVADQLQQKDWAVDRQHKPTCIHCTVTAHHRHFIDEYIEDLKEAIETVKNNPELSSEGEAAMYGMMAKIPFRGAVKLSIRKVMEQMYGPDSGEPDIGEITSDADGKLLQLVDEYGGRVVEMLDEYDGIGDALKSLSRKLFDSK